MMNTEIKRPTILETCYQPLNWFDRVWVLVM